MEIIGFIEHVRTANIINSIDWNIWRVQQPQSSFNLVNNDQLSDISIDNNGN